ncbi:MAG: DUF423 domain-containing protein [Alphaproteobacteria bacterium]|nr:DUF423 domain-containing protein [Alphaproteobacteria bacterium]MBU0806192.1 DUF423 domain-containing protein [Alphaproteobacteria bacterium]MBU0874273.1 DUF423 domain-containing protein [Alphaproteobacteria bacterium]MBU1400500.1 DUF423 domain-containing protein [Alphaproteobacteria bacterium]MBU1592888.1 DUF423 domain-containing protein [Alphaproteobacteria bacterium]
MSTHPILIAIGGLCGAAGVALSAAAAHSAGPNLGIAASFLLAHAPVFLAVGMLGGNRVMLSATAALLLGVLLFCGDLVMRDYAGTRLFPMAAPAGGSIMILGWLGIAASALLPRRPQGG